MDTWTLQAGFPLISVTLQEGHAMASQARFVVCEENVTDPNEPLNTTLGYRWHVPLTYITSEQPDQPAMHWMNLSDGTAPFLFNFFPKFATHHITSYLKAGECDYNCFVILWS